MLLQSDILVKAVELFCRALAPAMRPAGIFAQDPNWDDPWPEPESTFTPHEERQPDPDAPHVVPAAMLPAPTPESECQ